MWVMTNVGLTEFSREDVERAFAPIDVYLKKLMDRGVNMVMQNGVPLPILIGVEAHDRLIDHMANLYRPAGDIDGALRRSGRLRISASAKWPSSTNGRRR